MKIWKNTATLDALVPRLSDTVSEEEAEVALIGSRPIDLSRMPRLKGIFKCGVGTDNVPFEECKERGIQVCLPSEYTANVIYEETAAFAVSLIFKMLYREVGTIDPWKKIARVSASKREVLVVGVGNIGSRVVRKLNPTVSVKTFDIASDPVTTLDELLSSADIVSLHIPLSDENKGFFDAKKLSLMKTGAALVNTARGPVVEEEALCTELESGRLVAAFDVFWKEPYSGKLKNLHPYPFFMTPHVASNSIDFVESLAEDFERFLEIF